ncbi:MULTISPECIES: carboxypeptidase M32 [unclassified Granulicatella]|uniref:carboxypeptidase M32 n=1 Tax=unclassified Granulicatella TaxID=2630493 RepID=UPI00107371DD|nr:MULTISPECIES: carboxypeptidase M32 [unclassified Granulicatella]MBF0779695.1 carboxypeptidase M32 [Granulicatella sp. 19428wC4_WM01]TFU96217.1 carboxypeptidase M32 [Granulicatella sp. WM01]
MHQKELEFRAYLKEIAMFNEATALFGWDTQTGMPRDAVDFRAEVSSYFSGKAFEMSISAKMEEFLTYFSQHSDILSQDGLLIYKEVKKEFDLNRNIPIDRYTAYIKCLGKADETWHEGRKTKSFEPFKQSLEEIVQFLKEFIPLQRKDEATPYDVLLNQYEPGMTVEKLDSLFSELRDGLMAIRQTLTEKGTVPQTDFLSRYVPKSQQHKLVTELAKRIDYNFDKGRLDDTTHPFMQNLNRNDARITTRWNEHDFKMATFGVIHEAGHGIYEQNIDARFDYTPLATGTSMGMHESQSLFYEIIVGSHKEFWKNNFSLFQEATEGTFKDIDFDTFYKGLHKSEPSFIRIEADTLTYPLHIIIRYEIEKMIFNEDLPVSELPRVWNEKYQEYLGITPENDLEGVLQDVHWSAGLFGYFPSYALGYMYAAQLYHTMEKTLDFTEEFAKDNYRKIREWLSAHIHQYGSSKKPNELILEATGEALSPRYLLDIQQKRYFDIYGID